MIEDEITQLMLDIKFRDNTITILQDKLKEAEKRISDLQSELSWIKYPDRMGS